MKISQVTVRRAAMARSWLTDTVIATPLSGFPAYKDRRSSWFGHMTAAVVRIETDEGIDGLGYIGGGKAAAASIIGELLLEGGPMPVQDAIQLPDSPGFGYRLNERLLAAETGPVPIW